VSRSRNKSYLPRKLSQIEPFRPDEVSPHDAPAKTRGRGDRTSEVLHQGASAQPTERATRFELWDEDHAAPLPHLNYPAFRQELIRRAVATLRQASDQTLAEVYQGKVLELRLFHAAYTAQMRVREPYHSQDLMKLLRECVQEIDPELVNRWKSGKILVFEFGKTVSVTWKEPEYSYRELF
jgi:hypothetical protein